MAKQLDKITPRDTDFAKWYTDVVKNAGLMEYAPVKGTMYMKPYGYAIWELIQKQLDPMIKKLHVENVYFPLLIPSSLFNQEVKHIEGFAPEVATVTKVGDKELEEPLYIRPTSEVLFAQYFKNNIQSYRDLPMNLNQWVNVMRWEKTTRPFLRTSEFLWQEGHTMHETAQEAQDMALKELDVYKDFVNNYLLLPVISGRKTIAERFAGADETYTIESLMHDGQALQSGTAHNLGQNFTDTYDINFQTRDQKLEHPYGTSFGVSTRLIGAIIMTHSDDNGLVLPSKVAPTQVQIINIKDTPEINNVANKIADQLSEYRVDIDNSDKSFGFKISEAEIKGIPMRVEVGPRDLENGVVTISRRDNFDKEQIKIEDAADYIKKQLVEYDKALYANALKSREERTYSAKTLDEYEKIINGDKPGFVLVPFCGRPECEAEVKQKTSTNSRCIPFDQDGKEEECFNCKQKTKMKVYFARAY